MEENKALNYERENTMQRSHAGGKGVGVSATRTRRRKERERKAEEETHAMDKPKTIEEVSDGDLSEVKKDPVWKTWLESTKNYLADERRENIRRREQKRNENIHGDFTGDPDKMAPTPKQIEWKKLRDEKEAQEAARKKPKGRPKKKAWEVWLDNVTKPIPDSKGGRGSFQHCIDANQDKNNPGGWCKQIERKIGKGLGALGEGKLNRKTGKPMKLKPRKITLDDFEHTNEPSYFNQVMSEEEKKKKESKKAKEIGEEWQKYWNEHKDKLLSYGKKQMISEKPESDYYMDAGGNPQRKEKAKKILATSSVSGKKVDISSMIHYPPVFSGTDSELAAQKEKIDEADTNKKEKVEANTSDANKTDYFVEEIRSNIIYHNKILPIIGMIASQAARGMGKMGKKIGSEVLEGASEVGQGMLQGVGDEAEEEEQ